MFSIRRWIAAKMFAQNMASSSEAGASHSGYSRRSHRGGTNILERTTNTLIQFYYADEELNLIAAELDSFDGRKNPTRCTNLVNQLRCAQDKVISLVFRLMDELGCDRVDRDYRLKFPDDLLAGGENGESLNGQIWFGAECLAAGSNIMNHETESAILRPMAKTLTGALDQLRLHLRHCCTEVDGTGFADGLFVFRDILGFDLLCILENFDQLFSNFEYEYVKAMLPIKTVDEIEKQQDLTVLFSEALHFALKRRLISQDDVDECGPNLMITIPRLAIVYGLIHCKGEETPIFKRHKDQLSSLFKPFHKLLHRIRESLVVLRPVEVEFLEKFLTNEDNSLMSSADAFLDVDDVELSKSRFNRTNNYHRNISHHCNKNSNCAQINCDHLDKDFEKRRRHSADDLNTILRKVNHDEIRRPASATTLAKTKYCEIKLRDLSELDNVSVASTVTSSDTSDDMFEIALALNAKNSNYISDQTKKLLHRLFVSISGVADQLQSNYASDLRTILRNVFALHSSDASDHSSNSSVEEALEAREFDVSSPSSSSSSSSDSSAATTPTGTTNISFESSVEPSTSTSNWENFEDTTEPVGLPKLYIDSDESPTAQSADREANLMAPVWVPDELVSNCTTCSIGFTLIRRRHHCRNCGQIYCNNCSNHQIILFQYGYKKPVRVCNQCYDVRLNAINNNAH